MLCFTLTWGRDERVTMFLTIRDYVFWRAKYVNELNFMYVT